MKCNIEEKLKEYRRRKENEEKAELISTKPFWEKIFPEMVTKIFKSTTCNNENAVIHAANIMEDDSNKGGVSRMNLDDVNNINSHMSTTHKVLMRKNYQGKKEVSLEKSYVTQNPTYKEKMVQISAQNNFPPEKINWILLMLKISLWVVLFLLSLELELGAIFVLVSAFYLIFTNFRTGQRKPWEPSAYSVFNPGCEAIDGSLKPEQFEKEIRYGF